MSRSGVRPPELPAAREGSAAVRDGRIAVTDPQGDGRPAVLIPGDDVILMIEGQRVTLPVAVFSWQDVQVRPRRPACPVRGFRVAVSPDGLSAYLEVEEQGPPGYRIADAGPARVLALTAEPLPGLQANPRDADVHQALRRAGVSAGVIPSAVAYALASPAARTVQVTWLPELPAARTVQVTWLPEVPAARTVQVTWFPEVPAARTVQVTWLPEVPAARTVQVTWLPEVPAARTVQVTWLPEVPAAHTVQVTWLPEVPAARTVQVAWLPEVPAARTVQVAWLPDVPAPPAVTRRRRDR
ncbi:conserved domain protein [Symbiobacterium thermophilum IAM 14863]|uniref:Conserved domain protein n=2 Tax=Symbiobacterium thermophilum TaxID=2734 RepID=Q67LW0_SYMTH|nr:conserved domain protein [Symbiobacterium thermophilum IAM 14863]